MGKYADPECNDPKTKITSTTNERREIVERAMKQPMVPSLPNTIAPMSPYSPFGYSSSNGPYPNPYLSWLEETLPFGEFLSKGMNLLDAIQFIDDYGTPVYKRVKGTLPGGYLVEGTLGFLTQLSTDINDNSRIRSPSSIIVRGIAAGVEDGITETISTPVGGVLGAAGAACGPVAPICMGGGYLIGANGATWLMDNVVWQSINFEFRFYR